MGSPNRHLLGALIVSGLFAWLAGCAAPAEREIGEAGLAAAERVARTLAGSYAGRSSASANEGDSTELIRLDARIERVAPGGVETFMSQRQGEGAARDFALILRPTAVATRLEGTFSPLDAQGRPVGSCPIEVIVRRDGFVARTDAGTCRFGAGGEEVALIKEIAHDGQTLVIGDRVVDPESGETRLSDRVIQFERVRGYSGWIGVRDSGAHDSQGAWRVADEISIRSDGLGLDPQDAAGMALGVTLDLAPYRVREGEPPVLRLRVFDSASGELLGQSWADPLATRIGIALPTIQVGLRLAASRPESSGNP
ncbi:MAG TPA: hypothetical protein VJ908_12830 [Wenzhouxiangellaceae bacterium]|nr:hypothetical protein [Wenzhouxiangellaceae bacterium]